jgi:hypothetical protein
MTEDEFGDRLGDPVNALVPDHGVVVGGGDPASWGGTISVEADSALAAIAAASAIIPREASDVFLPAWPIVRAEAVREDVLDDELGLSPVWRRGPRGRVASTSAAPAQIIAGGFTSV